MNKLKAVAQEVLDKSELVFDYKSTSKVVRAEAIGVIVNKAPDLVRAVLIMTEALEDLSLHNHYPGILYETNPDTGEVLNNKPIPLWISFPDCKLCGALEKANALFGKEE